MNEWLRRTDETILTEEKEALRENPIRISTYPPQAPYIHNTRICMENITMWILKNF
jgi:hypothetical protein